MRSATSGTLSVPGLGLSCCVRVVGDFGFVLCCSRHLSPVRCVRNTPRVFSYHTAAISVFYERCQCVRCLQSLYGVKY